MNVDERRQALDEIAAEVAACTRCPLHEQRTLAVPGEGHPDTEVVFVGEGPGYNEDQQGRPFVGAAGKLLNELLKAIGWKRQEVFITNVVKCRPPDNRDPEPSEIAACAPYLRRQLEVLDPAVVVTLGRYSLQTFNPGVRIGASHGTLRPVDPETGARNALTYAMYHPAAALRAGAAEADHARGHVRSAGRAARGARPALRGNPGSATAGTRGGGPADAAHSGAGAQEPREPEPSLRSSLWQSTIEVAREAVAIHVEPEPEPVDENQMQLF